MRLFVWKIYATKIFNRYYSQSNSGLWSNRSLGRPHWDKIKQAAEMGSWVSSKKLKCVLFAYEEIKKGKIFKG